MTSVDSQQLAISVGLINSILVMMAPLVMSIFLLISSFHRIQALIIYLLLLSGGCLMLSYITNRNELSRLTVYKIKTIRFMSIYPYY